MHVERAWRLFSTDIQYAGLADIPDRSTVFIQHFSAKRQRFAVGARRMKYP